MKTTSLLALMGANCIIPMTMASIDCVPPLCLPPNPALVCPTTGNYPNMPCFVGYQDKLLLIDRSARVGTGAGEDGGSDSYFNDFHIAGDQLNGPDGLLGAFAAYMQNANLWTAGATHPVDASAFVGAYYESGLDAILTDAHNGVAIESGTDYGPITEFLTFGFPAAAKSWHVACQWCPGPPDTPSNVCTDPNARCVTDCYAGGKNCTKVTVTDE